MSHRQSLYSILRPLIIAYFAIMQFTAFAAVPVDSIGARLAEQLYQYPQEKVYVATDRSSYVAGDTIWLRAFVVNAADHREVDVSRYVYAELVTPFSTTQKRVKIIKRNGSYCGYIPLDEKMPEGDYTLSAYTLFMQNAGSDYFFKKNVRITSPYFLNSEITASPQANGDEINLRLNYKDKAPGENKRYEKATITLPNGKSMDKGFNTQTIGLKLDADDCSAGNILVQFNNYSKYINIPRPGDGIAVTFHPEGGYLIPDSKCKVAFKAIAADGLGRKISGSVADSKGNEVAKFQTLHAGMGIFSFTPKPSEKYTATYTYNGIEHSSALPIAEDRAASLQIGITGDSVSIKPIGNVGNGSMLVVHVRGNLVVAKAVTKDATVAIPTAGIPTGVAQALLIDRNGNALSERLFFSKGDHSEETWLSADKNSYKQREKVSIALQLPERGNYAVAVTDNTTSHRDTTTTILSNLLLQSDLRGNIESPAWYFDNSHDTTDALDALMLTQGWRRYNIPEAITGKYALTSYPIEAGQEITGTVRSLWREKPLKDAVVNAIAPKMGFAASATTDSDGRFQISGADYPDSTKFVLNAFNMKGKSEMNLQIDSFPFPHIKFVEQRIQGLDTQLANRLSVMQSDPNSRSILLSEITVVGRKPKMPEDVFQALAYSSTDYKQLESEKITNIDEYLRKIPGLQVVNEMLMYRNSMIGIYIDGVYQEPIIDAPRTSVSGYSWLQRYATDSPYGMLRNIPFDDIRRIDFLRPAEAVIFGSNAKGGALMVFLKRGNEGSDKKLMPELKLAIPLGYQRPAEFYSPRYDAYNRQPDGSDMRTTVYWNPAIKTDSQGNSSFEFYTSDAVNTSYNIRIEGITGNGNIVGKDETIIVK